jgi:hypothetical protein
MAQTNIHINLSEHMKRGQKKMPCTLEVKSVYGHNACGETHIVNERAACTHDDHRFRTNADELNLGCSRCDNSCGKRDLRRLKVLVQLKNENHVHSTARSREPHLIATSQMRNF